MRRCGCRRPDRLGGFIRRDWPVLMLRRRRWRRRRARTGWSGRKLGQLQLDLVRCIRGLYRCLPLSQYDGFLLLPNYGRLPQLIRGFLLLGLLFSANRLQLDSLHLHVRLRSTAPRARKRGQGGDAYILSLPQRHQCGHVLDIRDVDVLDDIVICRLVDRDVVNHLPLLYQGPRRPRNLPAAASDIQRPQIGFPLLVPCVAVPIPGEVGVVNAPSEPVVDPRSDAVPLVVLLEVVAEIIVAIGRLDEQGSHQEVGLHHILRHVGEPLPQPDTFEADRSEQQAAPVQWMVPEAVDKEAAAWGPYITVGCPAPIGPEPYPVAGPQEESGFPVDPAARHISAVVIGGRGGWSLIQSCRRRWQVLEFILYVGTPETSHPMPSAFNLLPGARHPATGGWNVAPETAHPEEVLSIAVPLPVARHPLDIVALGFTIGRRFLHRFRRRLCDQRRSLGLSLARLRVSFMHGPASKHGNSILRRRIGSRLLIYGWCLGGQERHNTQRRQQERPFVTIHVVTTWGKAAPWFRKKTTKSSVLNSPNSINLP